MLPGIGIFGTGQVVKIIIPFLKEKGFKIEALWGRTLTEASQVAQELDIPFYTTKIDDVLLQKDVDLLFVMCPPNLQAQISVKALGIGKHVLCDKPAGLSQSDALKMVRASQYYPSLISIVNYGLRFIPTLCQLRAAIQREMIGPLTLIDIRVNLGSMLNNQYDWTCDEIMGGGTVTMLGSHIIDLISHLTGFRAIRVHAVIRTFTKSTDQINGIRHISAPDFCMFQMELQNNILVSVTLNNHLECKFSQEVVVCGTNGYLTIRGDSLIIHRGNKDDVLFSEVEENITGDNILPKPYMKGIYKMICAVREAFLPVEDKKGWVKEPVAAAATFEDGLYVQAVIDALKKSSANKQWVRVNVITEEQDPNPVLSAAVRKSAISI